MVKEATVRKGYKNTDIGLIPEEWEVKKLNLICDVRDGTHESPKYFKEGITFITSKNIVNGRLDFSDVTYISKEDAEHINRRSKVDKGDILMSMIGTIGNSVFIDFEPNFCIKNVALIKPEKVEALFLIQLLYSQYYQGYINEKLEGGIQKFVSLGVLRELDVPLPPSKPEQTAIANSLNDVDALISKLEEFIVKKRNIKQGAMQQLLTGKKRLPGFSGKWEVNKLGEVAEIKTGKKNNDDKIEEGLYPFFVRSQQIERINSYSFDGEAILIPGEGNIGSIYHYINGRFDYHQRVYKISNFAEQYSGKFIYLSMLQNFNTHAMKNSVKATVDSLRLPTFQEFEIAFPPTKEEQAAIASVLSDMGAEIDELEQKLDKYKMIKQGMMQELLTGRTRLI